MSDRSSTLYIGLMSGTSMDGVDGVLVDLSASGMRLLATASLPMPAPLRDALFALQQPGDDEIDREARAGIALADLYGDCVAALLASAAVDARQVRAIGAHGQTVRHRPERGYTRQLGAPAALAERCGIDVVADFRSRDIAAGGQGAPLVPAFHRALFGAEGATRALCNIGGIANLTVLDATATTGFDTGPGNVFLDSWTQRHRGQPFDVDGQFAAEGQVVAALLEACLDEPYFRLPPPKSTGRDLFNDAWLASRLARCPGLAPADVQATLTALTAQTIAEAVAQHAPSCDTLYLCGGGALNGVLSCAIEAALQQRQGRNIAVWSTAALGLDPLWVEAFAFAWLAERFTSRQPANLPSVTGAAGPRILGALYPA
ncbi:anhydro-N-acetylmuramic acid kinase [Chitinasiproducens palmae]|uniref:Anhydro-N-acetylmuramic acid kinase n=1 Tax=Chitinasiproducens palmae TaxID=1770053 RepID=A0A1H2PN81_9BURK|nr:anhydro-N-acetylmuramic acid kinase [Chitinasiproducens palmae]SDV48135.1 anhydro-N-acetylmuramic acid kinase [Chitinasiproducens palmae]